MASFAGVGAIFFDGDTPSEEMERMTVFSQARAYVKYERDQFSTAAQDAYLELFHDLCAHRDYWFGDGDGDGIFSHGFNREHIDIVAMNAHQQLGDKDSFIPLFRRAVEYEIRTNMPLSVQEKSTVVYCLGWDEYYPLTLEKFRGVTDDMCWKAIEHVMAFERGDVDSLFIDNADGEAVEEKLQSKAT
jgi:hypothetical protein